MRKSFQARHGDVLIVRADALPEGATRRKLGTRGAVLAEGEVTGHAHVLTGPALELWELGNRLFASLPEGGQVSHEEHGVIEVPPGIYESLRQRVYSPEEVRNVLD